MLVGSDSIGTALILRLSSFGDIVLTEPISRALREHSPGCEICFLTGRQYTGIPELFSSVDRVIPYAKGRTNPEIHRLADATYDLIVDLQNNLRSRGITRSLNARTIVKHKRQRFLRFLAVHAPWIWKGQLKTAPATYADTIEPLGIKLTSLVPAVRPPMDGVGRLAESLGERPLIGICPGGSSEHKRWSEANFVALARDLSMAGSRVILVGSEADRPVIETIAASLSKIDIAVHIGNDVGATAALLSRCTVTVSNDSGLMHLAAAVGSSVVAIFGPTSPLLGFAPASAKSVVISHNLECSPCSYHGNRPCKYKTRQCLDAIEPKEIVSAVTAMVKDGR